MTRIELHLFAMMPRFLFAVLCVCFVVASHAAEVTAEPQSPKLPEHVLDPLAYIDAVKIHVHRFYEGKVGGTLFGIAKNSYELEISITEVVEGGRPGKLIKAYDTNRFDVVGSGDGVLEQIGLDFKILGAELVKLSREQGKYDELKKQIAMGKTNLHSGFCLKIEVFRLTGRQRRATVCYVWWNILAVPETRDSKGLIRADWKIPLSPVLGEPALNPVMWRLGDKNPHISASAYWEGYGGVLSSARNRTRAAPPPPTHTRFQLVFDRAIPVKFLPPAGRTSWSMVDEKTWLEKHGDGLESRYVWKEREKINLNGYEISGAVFTQVSGPDIGPPNLEIFIPDKGSNKMLFYSRSPVKGSGKAWHLVGTMKDFD